MKKTKSGQRQFVVCVDNAQYPAALELHKVYQAIPDDMASEDGYVRVVDESGEDYLYSADRFVTVSLPPQVGRAVARQANERRKLATSAQRAASTSRSARSTKAVAASGKPRPTKPPVGRSTSTSRT